ncbi:MAG TPA: 30S ribosomal protein S17 [Deltaproteobacteria bacterium]|nr:MAG: 30S ribosomal protein S17 [Deltaproteobacteria bacterium]HDM76259.1 30S ribosomal protein S17 [Deltaproteobacteria bacterium]HEC32323.1 30S ribosomal protein S17 [Deltaproteobacteria bacterium]
MNAVSETKNRKTLIGVVVSDKMDKTAVVQIQSLVKHPVYKKYVRRYTKVKAHDAENRCHIGDRVKVRECRPLSKTKRWIVVEIIERAKV